MTIILTINDLSEYGYRHYVDGGELTYKDFRLESRAFFQADCVAFVDKDAVSVLKGRDPHNLALKRVAGDCIDVGKELYESSGEKPAFLIDGLFSELWEGSLWQDRPVYISSECSDKTVFVRLCHPASSYEKGKSVRVSRSNLMPYLHKE